jgi:PAS domain S-box-containing protein
MHLSNLINQVNGHVCLLYTTVNEFLEVAIPYIREGIERNEYCILISDNGLDTDISETEVIGREEELVNLRENYENAIKNGYTGLRIVGDFENVDWERLSAYEESIRAEECELINGNGDEIVGGSLSLSGSVNGSANFLCCYSPDDAFKVANAVCNHEQIVVKKNGVWTVLRKECKEKEKIRLEKDGYRIAVENANEGIAVVQKGIIRFINPALTRMTGYTAEEVLGRPFTDFLPEEDARELMEKHLRRMKGDFNGSYRFRVFNKNGGVRWFEINAVPVEWEGGNATLNFLRDVTDEMIFEQKLRESEEKFRAICEAARDAIVLIDEEGIIRYWNSSAERIFGYRSDEIVGESVQVLVPECKAEKLRSGKCPEAFSIYAIRKGGRRIPIEVSLSTVSIAGKVNVIAVVRDVSENVEVFGQLAANLTQFEVSADRLRNPLAVIMTSLELVNEIGKEKVLDIIGEQARRMKDEVDGLRNEELRTYRLIEKMRGQNEIYDIRLG